ncbi:MAG: sigma 54-interacting transcriptional regulator [candidate division Zixibacteria bacterium]|nr:sigma 54-interacting transcriptional regulator [candidate division Zixibacteria bacterium]
MSTQKPSDKRRDLEFFKVILSSIADGVFTVDSDRVITSFNPAAEKITGVPASQAIGRQCADVFSSDICEKCLLDRTLKTGVEAIDHPVNIINSRGEKIPITISTAVLRDDEGKILGAVETFRDLSTIEHLRKELDGRYSIEDIISKSPEIHKLFAILPDIAESESTVLIQGPSGSGKELFAHAIHSLSPRKEKNLVIINCGTLPHELFESELFGYVQGAFTDARQNKAGKLAGAAGGTVFFDEIGDLPLSTQVKLLRLLQQREYEPVGSTVPTKVDIRIIAATNRDLKSRVAQGQFRDDLYFRLAVVKLELPPLVRRREDVPYLVDHFIRKYNARKGRRIVSVSPEVMSVLMHHDFPGNVRELENIIEYAFVICHDSIIQTHHLPAELLSPSGEMQQNPIPVETPVTKAVDEYNHILAALRQYGGNISMAARELGIHRTTLWRKMKRYQIESGIPPVKD